MVLYSVCTGGFSLSLLMDTTVVEADLDFNHYTNVRIINACRLLHITLNREEKRSRKCLLASIGSLPAYDTGRLRMELSGLPSKSRPGRKHKFEDTDDDSTPVQREEFPDPPVFIDVVSNVIVENCITQFIDRTGNCARHVRKIEADCVDLNKLPRLTKGPCR